MLIKTTFKKSKELEKSSNMQVLFVFSNITKSVNFRWKKLIAVGCFKWLYIFWIFFRWSLPVPSFIIMGYGYQVLGGWGSFDPHPWAVPKRPILNKVKCSEKVAIYQPAETNSKVNMRGSSPMYKISLKLIMKTQEWLTFAEVHKDSNTNINEGAFLQNRLTALSS